MAGDAATERKRMLLNLVSEVKARLDGKVDSLMFPIPQFIVVGKQSVGKSRLIEALAGEPFNFVSGTLGSRRPTVLEFRNVQGLSPSRWSVMDNKTLTWQTQSMPRIMEIVGAAHEELGNNVSEVPIRVKVEGEDCTDLGLVDLPGFRSYAKDAAMQALSLKIDQLVLKFMQDENNVMLCVEEAGDAAGFATLGKCKQVDPSYRRTILVRNKLDKYYGDLTTENINKWLEGFGDLPSSLARFAVSLPHWAGAAAPKPFGQMRQECADTDVKTLQAKGASQKYMASIGFQNFRQFMEVKIQQLFADALQPLLSRLNSMKEDTMEKLSLNAKESETICEDNILHATRSAGISFAQSFNFLMEGRLSSEKNRIKLEDELKAFHAEILSKGTLKIEEIIPDMDQFGTLDAYVNYLRDDVKVPGMDIELNGGAQFKRLMYEVEVFARFAGLGQKFTPTDVIQARGSGMSQPSWYGVINTLMMKNAPTRMQEKTKYVGERLKWFFTQQKDATVEFMLTVMGSPEEHLFSKLITEHAKVLMRNDTMKACVYKAYDAACESHRVEFMQMWVDYMNSMFQAPLTLLKSGTMPPLGDDYEETAPTFESTKQRIIEERQGRGKMQRELQEEIKTIPEDDSRANESVQMVQKIIEKTFRAIRCVVADQMQLYSESFFLMPMLRRLEGVMAAIELEEDDAARYRMRKTILVEEKKKFTGLEGDLQYCTDQIQKFKVIYGGGQ